MTLSEIALCLLWSVAVAGVAWYCIRMAGEMTYVTLADGRRQERRIPFFFRLLLPVAQNVAPVFRRPAFAGMRLRTGNRLIAAGFEGLLSPEEFLSLQFVFPMLFGALWIVLVAVAIPAVSAAVFMKLRGALFVLGILLVVMYPAMWLRNALETRHKSMRRALPFILDMLTLAVEAGMDFMSALQQNTEKEKLDPLREELLRVIREIQLGKTRRAALRDMSDRVGLQDLRSVVNALIQADELGVSIGAILRIQADQMRQRRFERAEKLANEAPVKMLFPLMFFIFPSVFLVLLGPIIVRLLKQGF